MGQSDNSFGYTGKIARVNLSNGEIRFEDTKDYIEQGWLGSIGIAIKILYDELFDWVTPYDPRNKVIFGAGTLIGTPAPGANKINISTLGPQMGGWASGCSDSFVGNELKYSGFDSIVVEGKAYKPVYLFVSDGKVEIRDAAHLWGKTTWETLEAIREEFGDPNMHTVSIGPAGERLVRGACLINDTNRAQGRGGIGAVMGSKNLKALVAKGSGAVQVADPQRFMEAVRVCREMFRGRKSSDVFHKYGTLSLMNRKQEVSGHNYKNFQQTALPEEMAAAVDPMIMVDKFEAAKQSFPGCALGGLQPNHHHHRRPLQGIHRRRQSVGVRRHHARPAGHPGALLDAQGQCPVQPVRHGGRRGG